MKNQIFSLPLGREEFKIEVKNLAERANADVLVSYACIGRSQKGYCATTVNSLYCKYSKLKQYLDKLYV